METHAPFLEGTLDIKRYLCFWLYELRGKPRVCSHEIVIHDHLAVAGPMPATYSNGRHRAALRDAQGEISLCTLHDQGADTSLHECFHILAYELRLLHILAMDAVAPCFMHALGE